MAVSTGARYMVGSSMTIREEVSCGGGREVQLQNVGRGKTVMYGVCKKEVFDIPTTVE